MLAWHFVNGTLRDGSPVPEDGVTLKHDGRLAMCESGFHASKRLIDALSYAPGNTICRVELGGTIKHDTDKSIAATRTILWRIDGEILLRRFARQAALNVIHLWDAPDVVRQYLTTGDETIRDAAWDVWAAGRAATWDAAKDAARAAAKDAAWAARAAAWAATWDAAKDAARDAAWDAAWAARDAAEAARDAAKDAVRDAQNKSLTSMVIAAHRKQSSHASTADGG